jgi:hypothetical protein
MAVLVERSIKNYRTRSSAGVKGNLDRLSKFGDVMRIRLEDIGVLVRKTCSVNSRGLICPTPLKHQQDRSLTIRHRPFIIKLFLSENHKFGRGGAPVAEASEHLTHSVLGPLGWLPDYAHWFTQLRLPSGEWLDVIVDPGDTDRFEFLTRAAELFRWAFDNERRVLAEAMRAKLLALYNDTWRQSDEPILTAEGLTARLDWTLLDISASDIVPVEFSYEAGELFGYHGVTVEVDADLRFRGIDLRG